MSVTRDKYSYLELISLSLALFIMITGCATSSNQVQGSDAGTRQINSSAGGMDVMDYKPFEGLSDPEFFPGAPHQPRLQFLATINSDADLKSRDIPLVPSTFLQIRRPYDMGSAKNKIYISDRKFLKVLVVDLIRKTLTSIAGPYEAAGIWVTDDDYKYIADFGNKQVVVFDDNNRIIRTYKDDVPFDKPTDVAVYEDRIYVTDINRHQIFIIDKETGDVIDQIGGVGTDEGMFYKPTHVIVDNEGNLYVNDFFNLRIQKLDPEGNHLKSYGFPGDTLGAFARPKGISVAREGHLYAVDAAFENVQIFDTESTNLLFFYGVFGLEPGNTYLPNAIYVDYNNVDYFRKYAHEDFDLQYLVYVGNTWGPVRLNVYGYGNWTGPASEQAELRQEESSSE